MCGETDRADLLMLLQASEANLGEHERMRDSIETLGRDYHTLRVEQCEMRDKLKQLIASIRELIDRMPVENLK
jgi:hypothetical protein